MVLLVLISMLFSQGEVVLATEIDLLDREKGMAETDYPLTYQGDEERQVKSIESDSSFYTERSLVPSRYESPYVTSVKDQNPYGTCWAFATLAASEANMVKSGLYDKNSIDLSEWHLAYFMAHSVADPLRGTNGDTFDLLYTSQSPNYMQRGGNEEIAAKKMANWQGPVKEEIASYEIIKSVYDPDGTDADLDVQASISEDNAFNDAAHLENSWYVSMKDRNVVKSLIMECGAAATSYYSSDPNLDVVDYYKYSNPSDGRPTINNTEIVKTNHAITLVGWDDNFSKEYFTIKPSNNGAWLCKNSWGNWGKDGYFWISYEDVAINTRNAIFYQYGKADNYEYNYQYDGGVFNGYKYYPDRDSMYAANMFQANTGEVLKAVGFYTVDPNYKCSISIYKDCEEGKPVSGKQVAYMEDIEELYVGYHTEKLDTKVFLEKGCRFSVVVRYETLDGAEARAVIEEESFGEWYKSSVSAKAGQSFISWDGQESNWKDIGISDRKNLRIKAFTNSAILSTSVFLNTTNRVMLEGDTFQLTANVKPENASWKAIQWSSSKPDVASVDDNGLVTAKKAGVAEITAEAVDGSSVKAECVITVEKKEIKVSGIRLNKERETLAEGDRLKLTATVSPSDATNKEIEWSSSVAGVATVDGTGLVTAQKPGRAVITAEAKNGSGVSASCEITVKKKEEEKIKVSGITLNKTKEKLKEGDTVRFTATVFPENASNKEVTWSSKDAAIASVDETGLVTAKKEGKTIITATAQDGNGVSASCEITVEKKEEEEIKVSGITLDKTKEILTEGDTIQLTATVRPEEASNQELEWSSSDRNVVTVNERGLVTALKEGKAIITATAQDGSGVKADCEITVKGKEEKKIKVSGITLSKTKEILQVNQTLKLTATVSPVNASNKELIWSSSNTNVATVDAAGLITAKSTGKAYITTIAKDGSGVCASCEIVVEKKPDETPQPVPESPEKDPALSYKKAIAKSTVLFLNDNLYYTGKAVIPQVRVSFNGQELALNADYTLSYENNINIGNAKLIIQGIGAFRGTKIVAFPIKAKTGTKFSYKKGKYKVLNASEVSYLGLTSTKTKKVQVPQTVIFGNKHFKVTQIADKALKNTKVTSVIIGDQVNCIGQSAMEGCKSLNQVVIGRNVSIIGNKAFCKCKKLKKITIYSSKLKANKIGSKTFKGIYANARVEVPVGKVKEYKKWLKSKGAGSKIRVVEK